MPANSVTLNGSGTDANGTIVSYSWTKITGPAQFTFSSTTAAAPTVSNLTEGTYTFRLAVTDNDGDVNTDDVQVVVSPAAATGNKSIRVNVFGGTNPYTNTQWNNWNAKTLTSPAFNYSDGSPSGVTAALSSGTTISDNGASYGGGMAPAEVLRYCSYASAQRTLTINGLSPAKSYSLELYASRANTGNSTVFTLNGTAITIVTDGNKTNIASFVNVTPAADGKLVLTIQNTATYNYLNGFVITENTGGTSGNQLPAANAGTDKTITLPTNAVTLNGSATDADGTIASYSWSKTAGPGQFTITSPAAASTQVTGLTEGTYTFRLTATDNNGGSSSDDVQVVVGAAPPPAGTKFIKVNVFGGTNPFNNTEWNNWNVSGSLTSAGFNYSDATPSGATAVLSASASVNDNGATYGGTMAPPEVLRYTSNSTAARTLTINGLSASKTYDIEFYASRNAGSGNSTVFTINGVAQTVATFQNLTQKVSFSNITPNTSGQIVVSIRNAQTYNYINGFIITERAGANARTQTVTETAAPNIEAPAQSSVSAVEIATIELKTDNGLSVEAVPNPARQTINLRVNSTSKQPVSLRIFNATGSVVAASQNITGRAQVSLGANLKPGTYFAEVSQGNNRKIIQVVKLP